MMTTRTASRSPLVLSLLARLVAVAPVILFSIAIFCALEAGSSSLNDWQTSAALVQKIVVTGVLLVVSVQFQFRSLNSRPDQE